jgi:hypothetical protein
LPSIEVTYGAAHEDRVPSCPETFPAVVPEGDEVAALEPKRLVRLVAMIDP